MRGVCNVGAAGASMRWGAPGGKHRLWTGCEQESSRSKVERTDLNRPERAQIRYGERRNVGQI